MSTVVGNKRENNVTLSSSDNESVKSDPQEPQEKRKSDNESVKSDPQEPQEKRKARDDDEDTCETVLRSTGSIWKDFWKDSYCIECNTKGETICSGQY